MEQWPRSLMTVIMSNDISGYHVNKINNIDLVTVKVMKKRYKENIDLSIAQLLLY